MKTLVITIHGFRNYGSVLQAFATQEKLKEYTSDVSILNYVKEVSNDNNFCEWQLSFVKDQIKNPIKKMLYKADIAASIKRFAYVCDSFLNKNVHLEGNVRFRWDELSERIKGYDYYCTGSDQVWNIDKDHKLELPMFWEGVDNKKIIFSYGSAFGRSDFDKTTYETLKEMLSKFSFYSTREQFGGKLLNQMGYENKVLMDPTLIMTKEFWENQASDRFIGKKYILVYQLQNNRELSEYAKTLANEMGLPIISIGTRFDHLLRLKRTIVLPSVEDWLSLFVNAEYIVTNSFHGACFSICLNKQFSTLLPHSSPERMTDLLSMFGLDKQVAYKKQKLVKPEDINYENVNRILKEKRNDTDSFLSNVFTLGEENEDMR